MASCCGISDLLTLYPTLLQMDKSQTPVGELFARVYLERGAPAQDSVFFRNRLDAFLQAQHYKDYGELSVYLKREAGLIVTSSYHQSFGVFYDFSGFFTKSPIKHVLSTITLIWRFLCDKYPQWDGKTKVLEARGHKYPRADAWHAFVSRTLREENMAYALDEKCGVHYFVDEEFERNRASTLKCLELSRYTGARTAFEAAHSYLDAQPADTKAAVRSIFEAVEIIARLMDPESKNLNKWQVANKLKPFAVATANDQTEADTIAKLFDGFSDWVDALHNYRHGQGVEHPVAPSLTIAVYVVSTGASVLRYLVQIDSRDIPDQKRA